MLEYNHPASNNSISQYDFILTEILRYSFQGVGGVVLESNHLPSNNLISQYAFILTEILRYSFSGWGNCVRI